MSVVVETRRLRLRRYTEADLKTVAALLSEPITMQHWPEPLTNEQVRAWLVRAIEGYVTPGHGRFAVELVDGTYVGDAGILVGEIMGRAENDLGYIIAYPHWRLGYGLECARACFEYGRGQGLRRIIANMAHDNVGSIRVAQRLGFTFETRFQNPRNRNKETLLFAWNAPDSTR
jgi:[ribosomal protein S5]-alanine N-acetyltransferase